jgi:hypothetical protein
MKKLLLAALLSLPFFYNAPKNYAQVNLNVNIGNPAVQPWPNAVWVNGYYYYDPIQVRRVWVPGKWVHSTNTTVVVRRHDNGRHLGWYKHGHGRGHD